METRSHQRRPQDFINFDYVATCNGDRYDPEGRDGTPDCGHNSCGLLCDVAMMRARSNTRRAYDPNTDDMIVALREEGLSYRKIAAAIGLGRGTVANALTRLRKEGRIEA